MGSGTAGEGSVTGTGAAGVAPVSRFRVIRLDDHPEVVVVVLSGRLGWDRVALLEQAAIEAAAAAAPVVLVDFTDVTFLASGGIRELQRLQLGQRDRRGRFALAGMRGAALRAVQTAGMMADHFPTVEEAVRVLSASG